MTLADLLMLTAFVVLIAVAQLMVLPWT